MTSPDRTPAPGRPRGPVPDPADVTRQDPRSRQAPPTSGSGSCSTPGAEREPREPRRTRAELGAVTREPCDLRDSRDPRDPRPSPSAVRTRAACLIWFHPVMAAPWLLLLLLTLVPQACAVTLEPAPHFRNLRLEPNLLRLSWDGDVTSGSRYVHCQKGANTPVRAPRNRQYCTFASLSLCHVTNFSVFLEEDPGSAAWIQFPESDTDRASAATDLRCWVHNVDVMTCRWGQGPGAHEHAQYRMWWRDASLGRDRDRECEHYDVTDAQGAHLGCRVDLATLLPTHHVTVTVTGGGASCSDISVDLQRVEVLTPPVLAAVCNGSEEARLRWEMRSHFYHSFQYELQINKSSHAQPETEKTSESHFRVLIPGSASFRVRANPTGKPQISNWSRTVQLDCAPSAAGKKHVTVMAAALAALGAGLAVLGTLLLCRRTLRTKLFPKIPRVKDPGSAAESATVMWTAAPEDPEVVHVTEA